MNYFEKCLTLGDYLSQEDCHALYKFLLESKGKEYFTQAVALLANRNLAKTVASGLVSYSIRNKSVSYSARGIDSDYLNSDLRSMALTPFKFINIRRLTKFFAQSEVDVIRNYPLPSAIPKADNGFGKNTYPYYSLSYYSDGQSRLSGLINKLRTDDKERLTKLRTL